MKVSQWKAFWADVIDGVQREVGIAVPVLDRFRARLDEAAKPTKNRQHFEHELDVFLHSQPFLREACERHLREKAAQAMEDSAALLKKAEPFVPQRVTGNNPARDTAAEEEESGIVDVWDAIRRAEHILPGSVAPEGQSDRRWQAIMRVEDFIEDEPDAIWPFIVRWGSSTDKELRSAVATCLLEDLLEFHFVRFFPQVEVAVQSNPLLADTFLRCWKLGQAEEPGNAELFERLQAECRSRRAQM